MSSTQRTEARHSTPKGESTLSDVPHTAVVAAPSQLRPRETVLPRAFAKPFRKQCAIDPVVDSAPTVGPNISTQT